MQLDCLRLLSSYDDSITLLPSVDDVMILRNSYVMILFVVIYGNIDFVYGRRRRHWLLFILYIYKQMFIYYMILSYMGLFKGTL